MRIAFVMVAAAFAGHSAATLPPAPESAKAQATETAAKNAWADKVAAYKLCLAQDRAAEAYHRDLNAASKPAPPPVATPPCVDPGPYVAPLAQRPLEASGAHSPAETAASPPGSPATSAEVLGSKK